MNVCVKESAIVRPMQETPKHYLRLSDLDLLAWPAHLPTVYFYRRPNDDSSIFFEADLLKKALSKVLVPFYPLAGRLGRDESGRVELHCNAEGVLFIEAETNCAIDDLGDSTQTDFRWLFPTIDYTKNITSYPILLAQITHFECGGVCLGICLHHTITDGTSAFHFIKAWAEMTCELPISTPPSFDRTLLNVGLPTSPTFQHIEYDPPPSLNAELKSNPSSVSTAILKLSADQINTLKTILKKDLGSDIKYSRFEILAAHIWRCLCIARGLYDDQASRLRIATDGRFRLNPPLPGGYIGNAVFAAVSIALSGDLQSEPLKHTIERIHEAINRMDDVYLKSVLVYIKQQSDLTVLRDGDHKFKSPNLYLSNLSRMPIYDANFGWGQPIYFRPVGLSDGSILILPSPTNDGCLYTVVNLETHHLNPFKKLFYDIMIESKTEDQGIDT